MAPEDDINALHLISDILDRLIESQETNAKKSAELTQAVHKSNAILEEIKIHFTNGFRLELKSHISSEISKNTELLTGYMKESSKNTSELNAKADKLIETLTKPWFWIKMVGAIIVSLGIITGAIVKILQVV